MIYTAPVRNVFYVGLNITRGLCPGNLDFFGSQMALAYRLVPFQAQKSLDYQGPPS